MIEVVKGRNGRGLISEVDEVRESVFGSVPEV